MDRVKNWLEVLIEEKRNGVLGVMGVMVLGLVFFLGWSYWEQEKEEGDFDGYYEASKGYKEGLERLREAMERGDKPSEDEIGEVIGGYEGVLEGGLGGYLGYLSRFKIGVVYGVVGDYKRAVEFFGEAGEMGGEFGFEAVMNKGHSLMNLGYELEKAKKYKEAIEEYGRGYEAYVGIEEGYELAPNRILSYRYRGLVKERLSFCQERLGRVEEAMEELEVGKREYEKMLEVLKGEVVGELFLLRRRLDGDARLGVRRVEMRMRKLRELNLRGLEGGERRLLDEGKESNQLN